jgi:Predicted membrane-bound metal-dependent hydrolase (DUF457).
MSPLEHFLVALIPVAIYLLLRRRRLPSKSMLVVICFGSLLPDIVDKPIAYADLIPWGRVFMHSLPFAIPVVSLVLIYAVRTNRLHLGAGFSAGYLLHLPGDWHQHLLRGEIPPDLLWPIVSVPAHPNAPYWAGPNDINIISWSLFSVIILAIAAIRMGVDISTQIHSSSS